MSSATGTVYGKGTAYAPGAAYNTCTASYCHSNGQSDNAKAAIKRTTPTWGMGATGCGSCHNDMSVFINASSGSHFAHANTVSTTAYAKIGCGSCHSGYTATVPAYATHVNKKIDLNGTILTTTSYSKYSAAGFTPAKGYYGTCSVTNCHGSGRPTWGATAVAPVNGFPYSATLCLKCHGSSASSPFYSTAIPKVTVNTDAKVGAHFNHLSSNTSRISNSATCSDCHNVPTAATLTVAPHLSGSATPTFPSGSLALTGGIFPTYSSATVSCGSTYCHGDGLPGRSNARATGAKKAAIKNHPRWNSPFLSATIATAPTAADCGACHGFPPRTASHAAVAAYALYTASQNIAPASSNCNNCHKHLNANGTFNDISKHINGTVEGGSCIGCHSSVIAKRNDSATDFTSQSHHVQRTTLDVTHCAACHYEANTDGTPSAVHTQVSGKSVDLVQWNSAATSVAADRATKATMVSYTANGKRKQIAKLNNVCLGCHSSVNAAFKPFGDNYTTDNYSPETKLSLPKTSILSRYSSTRTVAWSPYGNFSTASLQAPGANRKNRITKALSAHGKAALNQMPVPNDVADTSTDEIKNISVAANKDYTYSGNSNNRNVFCYDCHNSHGSAAAGITSSYSSATGRNKGGLLKATTSGLGGYSVTYTPTARTITYSNYSSKGQAAALTTTATFNAGASICNDCHNSNANKNGTNISRPWSILTTFSSARSIVGYWSTPYFDNYTVSSTKHSVYKAGTGADGTKTARRKPMGGHFGSSIGGNSAGHSGEINGLCTGCHDPHGVSNALAPNRQYGVPLLKGTWITSPYREDHADITVARGGGSGIPYFANAGAIPGYHIDQNTLLAQPLPNNGGAGTTTSARNYRRQAFRNISNAASKLQPYTATQFAGLCMQCHSQASLTDTAAASTANWKTKNRIHQSVDGWAATTGTGLNVNNKIHNYTCSKCHTPHVSRLPRLMVTNCLDYNHVGKVASGGTISATVGSATANFGNIQQVTARTAYGAGRFPAGGAVYSGGAPSPGNGTTNVGRGQNPGPWWFQPVTIDGTTPVYGSNCHASGTTSNGAAGTDPKTPGQYWNKHTPW
jgi:predicted CxxxxCH...CXXCH cytochrome family protein